MKILVLADEENKAFWDFYDPRKLEGVDLIISCGDLKPRYLEFIVTMKSCPLLYVGGNHDKYSVDPPEGCDCIENKVYDFHGLRILGLGGSIDYVPGENRYCEAEMRKRIRKAERDIRMKNGFDILVTHVPPKGYGDLPDMPHQGFECFNDLLNEYKPKYMLHGHVHLNYGYNLKREVDHPSGTKIINCYDNYMLEVGDDEHPAQGKTGSFLYDLYMSLSKRS
ncbi:MAG: metallophosphoesterase [Eubacterium sp.]|nr:metallophosphoesterase [Eubacterium sp.]